MRTYCGVVVGEREPFVRRGCPGGVEAQDARHCRVDDESVVVASDLECSRACRTFDVVRPGQVGRLGHGEYVGPVGELLEIGDVAATRHEQVGGRQRTGVIGERLHIDIAALTQIDGLGCEHQVDRADVCGARKLMSHRVRGYRLSPVRMMRPPHSSGGRAWHTDIMRTRITIIPRRV